MKTINTLAVASALALTATSAMAGGMGDGGGMGTDPCDTCGFVTGSHSAFTGHGSQTPNVTYTPAPDMPTIAFTTPTIDAGGPDRWAVRPVPGQVQVFSGNWGEIQAGGTGNAVSEVLKEGWNHATASVSGDGCTLNCGDRTVVASMSSGETFTTGTVGYSGLSEELVAVAVDNTFGARTALVLPGGAFGSDARGRQTGSAAAVGLGDEVHSNVTFNSWGTASSNLDYTGGLCPDMGCAGVDMNAGINSGLSAATSVYALSTGGPAAAVNSTDFSQAFELNPVVALPHDTTTVVIDDSCMNPELRPCPK